MLHLAMKGIGALAALKVFGHWMDIQGRSSCCYFVTYYTGANTQDGHWIAKRLNACLVNYSLTLKIALN